ncbi:hypothetical protein [Sulfurimonas sp.]|uniref:hypothetical protein n=1 Tax=Sulfurimonas sp. TaxID=2022749 RepID=UPI0025DD4074|nr:hypothetical protein [Sulfurimonas sp.]MDD5157766.1 hypothetical protein [Sulfurimonas sp.]
MKIITLCILLVSLLTAQDGPFTLRKKDTIGELEAKIVAQIAADILNKDVNIYVVGEQKDFMTLGMNGFRIAKNCKEANFIFVSKQSVDDMELCENSRAIHFTNSRELFNKNRDFVGLFYWFKSRPNITFSSKRLESKLTMLPKSYEQFIEEF